MKEFKKDLSNVAKIAKDLVARVEKLQKQYAEMEQKHPKMPPKTASPKKPVAKKTASKRSRGTVAGSVLAAVGRSKKGVDTTVIVEKTGFDRKKVWRTISLLKRQGKVRSAGRGLYASA